MNRVNSKMRRALRSAGTQELKCDEANDRCVKNPRTGRLAFEMGWCTMPNNPRVHLFIAEIERLLGNVTQTPWPH